MDKWRQCGKPKPCKNKRCRHNKNDHTRIQKNNIRMFSECGYFDCTCARYEE